MPPPRIVDEDTVTVKTQTEKKHKTAQTNCSRECAYDYAMQCSAEQFDNLPSYTTCAYNHHSSGIVCCMESEVWPTSDVTRIGVSRIFPAECTLFLP